MTLRLNFNNAAEVIAELVRQGVCFVAEQDGNTILVTFTGGF